MCRGAQAGRAQLTSVSLQQDFAVGMHPSNSSLSFPLQPNKLTMGNSVQCKVTPTPPDSTYWNIILAFRRTNSLPKHKVGVMGPDRGVSIQTGPSHQGERNRTGLVHCCSGHLNWGGWIAPKGTPLSHLATVGAWGTALRWRWQQTSEELNADGSPVLSAWLLELVARASSTD